VERRAAEAVADQPDCQFVIIGHGARYPLPVTRFPK
jgi:hypothetical protein